MHSTAVLLRLPGSSCSQHERVCSADYSCWVGLLQAADRVNFMLGGALNPANKHISFRQQGILPRSRIVAHIAQKLIDETKKQREEARA